MNFVNAIAKARFSTAKPQSVQLHKGDGLVVELLCLESGQGFTVSRGEWSYYVLTGTAQVTAAQKTTEVSTGQIASAERDETHALGNTSEGRLVVLATGIRT